MGEQSAVRRREAATKVKLVPAEDLVNRRNEIHDMIARCAYALFEIRGRAHGHDLDDWIDAELQVLHPCRHDMKESGRALVFLADLQGSFTADQLKVSVEPRRLTVSGERTISMMCGDSKGTHTEPRKQLIFRTEDLPVDVDPSRTAVKLEGELLEIVMPKVAAAKKPREKAEAASSGE